jgi:hypothetical protein
VHQAVLRSFAATGSAPDPGTLVVPGAEVPDVLVLLHDQDFIRLGADGRIEIAYPFSAKPTPHVVRLPGDVEAYAMCAIDALGIAPMLGAPVQIRSSDPATGAVITVRVPATGSGTVWDPDTAVVVYGGIADAPADPGDPQPAADVCCGMMNFFANRSSAANWMAAHPAIEGAVLDHADALRLGTEVFGPLLAASA